MSKLLSEYTDKELVTELGKRLQTLDGGTMDEGVNSDDISINGVGYVMDFTFNDDGSLRDATTY